MCVCVENKILKYDKWDLGMRADRSSSRCSLCTFDVVFSVHSMETKMKTGKIKMGILIGLSLADNLERQHYC